MVDAGLAPCRRPEGDSSAYDRRCSCAPEPRYPRTAGSVRKTSNSTAVYPLSLRRLLSRERRRLLAAVRGLPGLVRSGRAPDGDSVSLRATLSAPPAGVVAPLGCRAGLTSKDGRPDDDGRRRVEDPGSTNERDSEERE
jgi:hypothetical protein